MQVNKPTKILGGAALAVVLGAIGSGVWENVFSPATTWLGRTMLTLITLGVKSASDGIYQEVAQGYSERYSVLTYAFINTIVMMIPAATLAYDYGKRRGSASKQMRQLRSLEGSGDTVGLEQARTDLLNRLSAMERLIRLLLWVAVGLGVVLGAQSMTMTYANKAITHFNQSLTIAAPFINATEERVIRSDFARVSSREDYVRVINGLEARVKERGVQLPEFTIW